MDQNLKEALELLNDLRKGRLLEEAAAISEIRTLLRRAGCSLAEAGTSQEELNPKKISNRC